jgi:hypothetical protein
MGENGTDMMVSFSKFLYPVLARIRPLTDPGLPRDGPKQMSITGLQGTDLPVLIFSNL